MRFVTELPPAEPTVKFSVRVVGSGSEVELRADDGKGNEGPILGVRSDGRVVRYSCQGERLLRQGFQVDEEGYIKLFN